MNHFFLCSILMIPALVRPLRLGLKTCLYGTGLPTCPRRRRVLKLSRLSCLAGPEGVLVVGLAEPENKQYVGKRLSEIAAMQHKDPSDAAMDLILADHTRVETIFFMMSEDNVKLQLRQPGRKIGTDARGPGPTA